MNEIYFKGNRIFKIELQKIKGCHQNLNDTLELGRDNAKFMLFFAGCCCFFTDIVNENFLKTSQQKMNDDNDKKI